MRVFLVDLEAVDTRYTKQWKSYLPIMLENAGLTVTPISGGVTQQNTTPGAFLNFAGTNNYKAQQMCMISDLFIGGKGMPTPQDGDYFLYTDAWNPTVIQLKYMAELLGIKIKIGGLWHAGSYDPQDFLGRLIGDAPWVRNAEASMFYCYDHNFFATKFHLDMFCNNLFDEPDSNEFMEWHKDKIKLVGWPMEYLPEILAPYANIEKKDKIIFPHRLAPEKQIHIFQDLARELPEFEWFVAQESKMTKEVYHQHLAESKVVFSANLQETLGISMYEGALVGAFPLMPDRLSYHEMWPEGALYPSEWTESFMHYQTHKDKLVTLIRNLVKNNNTEMHDVAKNTAKEVGEKFFNGSELYKAIVDSKI